VDTANAEHSERVRMQGLSMVVGLIDGGSNLLTAYLLATVSRTPARYRGLVAASRRQGESLREIGAR
jgi:hypothetical protein